MERIIRPLQRSDFSDLNHYFGPDSRYRKPMETWQKYLQEQEKGERFAKVLEIEKKAVGIGSLKIHSDYPFFLTNQIPEIHDLVIADEYQGKGSGRLLIEALEQQAKDLNYQKVGLGVGLYEDYGKAQILYIKSGYVPDGRGATYKNQKVVPGTSYPVDDDLIFWLIKTL